MAKFAMTTVLVLLSLTSICVHSIENERDRSILSDWILNKNFMRDFGRSGRTRDETEKLKVNRITVFSQPEGREAKMVNSFTSTQTKSRSAFNSCMNQFKENWRLTTPQIIRACARYSSWGRQARRPPTYHINKKATNWFNSLG